MVRPDQHAQHMRHHQPDEGDGSGHRHRDPDPGGGQQHQPALDRIHGHAQMARLGFAQQQGVERVRLGRQDAEDDHGHGGHDGHPRPVRAVQTAHAPEADPAQHVVAGIELQQRGQAPAIAPMAMPASSMVATDVPAASVASRYTTITARVPPAKAPSETSDNPASPDRAPPKTMARLAPAGPRRSPRSAKDRPADCGTAPAWPRHRPPAAPPPGR